MKIDGAGSGANGNTSDLSKIKITKIKKRIIKKKINAWFQESFIKICLEFIFLDSLCWTKICHSKKMSFSTIKTEIDQLSHRDFSLLCGIFVYWCNSLIHRFNRVLTSSYYKSDFRGMLMKFRGPVKVRKFLAFFINYRVKLTFWKCSMARDNMILTWLLALCTGI